MKQTRDGEALTHRELEAARRWAEARGWTLTPAGIEVLARRRRIVARSRPAPKKHLPVATANPAEALRAGLVRWLATAPERFTLDEAAQGIGRTLPLAQADRNRICGMLRGAGYTKRRAHRGGRLEVLWSKADREDVGPPSIDPWVAQLFRDVQARVRALD